MLPTTFSATILAVDDDPLVLDLLERMLIKQPYTVLRAENADSAWQIIQTRDDLDLVLLDVLMPGSLTGLDLCRKVRADQTRSYVPIILVTALGQTEQMAQGLDAGADDYIAKPFRAREMLARVHAALRIRAVQRQLFEAENRYRVLVETSRDLIFALDANGWLSYVSPICEALTGYSAELIQAEYPPFVRCLHPDDARRFTETLIARPTPPDGLDLEFRFVRSNKQVRWMALSWSPIRDRAQALVGLQGTLRDITHRREIEAATWQRSQELTALNLIATRVNQTLELDTTLNETLATLMEVLGIEFGTIHIVEEDQFVLHAVRGLSKEAARNWYQPFGGLDPAEWRTHAPIVARERSDQSLGEIGLEIKGLGVQAWMIVPLRAQGLINGLLLLASRAYEKFDPNEVTLISTVAEQISLAIVNARLFEETRRRLEQTTLLYDISLMLTSTLNLDKVLRVTMEATVSMVQGEAGSVMLLDEDTGELVFAAAAGPAGEKLLGVRLPAGTGIAGRALREGRSLLVDDTQIDQRFYPGVDRVTGLTTRRLLAAPLRSHGKIIGVMEVINKRSGSFTESDVRVLELLASTAAVAIDNARLYTRETQLSDQVRKRNRELNALHAISAALSQSLEIQTVTDVALTLMKSLLEFDEGAITLLPESNRPATISTTTSDWLTRNAVAQQFSEQAVAARTLQLLPDTRQIAEAEAWHAVRVGAFAAVPLWGHDRVEGVLHMAWRAPHEFAEEGVPLLAAIGQQIGVAIERAELYEVAQRRAREIEQSYAQLVQSEKLAATGRLAMSLAHEINNPLQAIQNCLHLVLEFPLPDDRRVNYLNMAREETERLSILVQSMLDFYRPSHDEQPTADVHAVIDRVLALTEEKIRHSQIEMTLDFPPGPLVVQTAPDQLGQVFLNLVVNAVEAMGKGGSLRIEAKPTGDMIETRFIDSGPGIPPAELPHIFEPFYTTKAEGTGLGLAISFTIIERQRGTLEVDSHLGQGTTFMVRLPKALERRRDEETE